MSALIQFFLVDHVGMTGLAVGGIAIALKMHIIRTCPSHPNYRGPR